MKFIVPEKINRAVSTSDLSRLYGKNNSNIVKSPLSTASISQNKINSISSTDTVQQTKSTIKRKRIVSSENLLIKGQKWTVAGKNGSILVKLKIGIGWEVSDSACEVDASAFMLAKNGKVPDESCFIFYGQDKSSDNSVIFQSNSNNMNLPDDAEINISLDSIREDVEKIIICLTIYESFQRKLDFSIVKNIYARIMDGNGTEIARYNGEYLPENVTSLVVGELYRYKDSWKFHAVGSGYRKDLADFCGLYGIQLK